MNAVKLKILDETFKNRFDIERFKKFTREFFNEPEILSETRHTAIWREYEEHVAAYYTIAKYTDSEDNSMIIMAVELKKDKSVERARSMQRNFISKVLDENELEAAIVAFYSEDEPSWRLSFVRLDYSLTDKGIKLDLTPARRYSYLVGENEPNHTAQEQLLTIFEDDKNNPTFDQIEEAFSVEKVTKDFFNQYKDKYLDLKEHLEKNEAFKAETKKLGFEVDKFAEQFAKKLMGQLAFLYFLQKKGWLGVRIMPEDHSFIAEEFKEIYSNQDETHKTVLEKVFKRNIDGNMKMSSQGLFNLSEHEAELLSDCFVGTKYDMPWGSGDRTFIRGLFNFCIENTNKNFFNDYLEPFFYEALNKKRKHHYYKRFNCKIPFLNGGLFEPIEGYHWRDVDFEIPNDIFSNEKEKGRDADGILDIFDRFNFTMNEAEPLEKEVAVDPEMLGKIFENLLDVSDRKSKGAFYTPREIVHYMCQESLINYLVNEVNVPYDDMKEFILYGEIIRDADNRKNVGYSKGFTIKQSIFDNIVKIDKALENVKLADPAVGSGAFPLGMLNEIVRARNNITEYIIRKDNEGFFGRRYGEEFIRKWRSPYEMKMKTIKNSIFAVDIEPSAVDIAKLRLWLSVVVDQEIDEVNPEPHPLPNLDCNIMVGNSLIDEFEGIQLFDKTILTRENDKKEGSDYIIDKSMQMSMLIDHTDEMLKEMFELQDRYFEEDNEENKRELKKKIDDIRDDLIRYKLQKDGNTEGLKRYEESLKNKTRPYFIWELEFAKVFKDNGGFDIVIGNPPYVNNEAMAKEEKEYYKSKYIALSGHYDLYVVFYEKGFSLLKNKGILSYITSNKWFAQKYGYGIRRLFLANRIIKILDFGNTKIFSTATVDTEITVVQKITTYKEINNYKKLPIYEYDFLGYSCKNGIGKLAIDNVNFKLINTKLFTYNTSLNFIIDIDEEDITIIEKVNNNTILMEEIYYITLGAVIHCKASKNTKKEFLSNEPINGYKKYFEGKDIDKWIMKDCRLYLKYMPEMHREPRFKELFENKKIVAIRMSTRKNPHRFAIDEGGYIADSAIVAINYNKIKHIDNIFMDRKIIEEKTEDSQHFQEEYVLAILNSNLLIWYFFKLFSDGLHFYPSHLKQFPIKKCEDKILKNEIVSLVNKIIYCKLEQKDKEISNLENNLNRIIYDLYNLNSKEIECIETFIKDLRN